jgi:phosphatidylglycerophosphatase A
MPDVLLPLAGPTWARWVATVAGLGFLRPGPGTWGSIGTGLFLWILVQVTPPSWVAVILMVVALTIGVFGWWSVHRLHHDPRTVLQDPPQVVVDEAFGVSLALLVVPTVHTVACPTAVIMVAVLMFRVLDIAKPYPIDRLETLPGATGVMADDALAGLLAGLAVTMLWA